MDGFEAATESEDGRGVPRQIQGERQAQEYRRSQNAGSVAVYQTAWQIVHEAARLRAAHRYWQRTRCPSPVHRTSPHERSDDEVRVPMLDLLLLIVAIATVVLLTRVT
jgi:hypothetical protein